MKAPLFQTLLFVLLLVGSEQILAQDSSPTLGETTSWIKGKLEGVTSAATYTSITSAKKIDWKNVTYHRYLITYKDVSVDGCKISWNETLILDLGDTKMFDKEYREEIKSKVVVDLSKLDPFGLNVGAFEPYDMSNTEHKVTSESRFLFLTDSKTKRFDWRILFDDLEMAKRFHKAFENAIKKCGGKVEPF